MQLAVAAVAECPVVADAATAHAFYILHLPMATLIAFFVVQTSLHPALKYTIIVVLAVGLTLAVSVVLRAPWSRV